MTPRILDFDAAYAELHEDQDEQQQMMYKGKLYDVGDIPIFTQMRMVALASGDYESIDPATIESIISMFHSICPELADEMDRWSITDLQAFMRAFKAASDGEEDAEAPNTSTAPAEA